MWSRKRVEKLSINKSSRFYFASFRQFADIDIVLGFDSDGTDKFFKALEPDLYISPRF